MSPPGCSPSASLSGRWWLIRERSSGEALDNRERVLLEGGQATLLDNDHGTYPRHIVESHGRRRGRRFRHPCASPGVRRRRHQGLHHAGRRRADANGALRRDGRDHKERRARVRYDHGPQQKGGVAGSARQWAASLNGITHVAITLLDVLSAVDEINICVGYEIDGERVDGYPMNQTDLHHARPVYKSLPGWGEDITWCRMRGTSRGRPRTSSALWRPKSGLLCA